MTILELQRVTNIEMNKAEDAIVHRQHVEVQLAELRALHAEAGAAHACDMEGEAVKNHRMKENLDQAHTLAAEVHPPPEHPREHATLLDSRLRLDLTVGGSGSENASCWKIMMRYSVKRPTWCEWIS
jgi:hypothetical protein